MIAFKAHIYAQSRNVISRSVLTQDARQKSLKGIMQVQVPCFLK